MYINCKDMSCEQRKVTCVPWGNDCLSLQLPVIAADLRGLSDTSRSASGIVRVQVLDINDNLPTFLDPVRIT